MAGSDKVAGTVHAINSTAGKFGGQDRVMARIVEMITVGDQIDTGNGGVDGAFNDAIRLLASSVVGLAKTFQSDHDGLQTVAAGFAKLGQAVQWPAGDG